MTVSYFTDINANVPCAPTFSPATCRWLVENYTLYPMNRHFLHFDQARRWTKDVVARKARALPANRSVPYLVQVVGLAAVYFAAAKLALLVAIPPGYATAVWPPSGIALAAVLLRGSRIWPGIWLGASLVNVTVQSSLVAATLIGAGNTLEALAGAVLVRAYIGIPRVFLRGEDVVKFIAIGALSATVAATIAAAPLIFVHSLNSAELFWNWWTWWQGDSAGIIIVTPLILSWTTPGESVWTGRKLAEGAILLSGLLGVTYAIFGESGIASIPLTFAILPFIIWAAFRFHQREVTTLHALVCAMAVWFTLGASGPFAQQSLNVSLLLLLAFMCTVVATGLVLNAVIDDRKRAVDSMQRALRNLREQAIRDPLTTLYNRRFLQDYLPRELLRAARDHKPLAVIMIDLDRFKQINDSIGHAAGDQVLVELGALLKRHVRGSDIACRYGGEEFTVVLPGATLESARRRGEEICSAIRREREPLRGITASLGVALFPGHAADADALLRAADRALYEAKGAGRDRVMIFAGDAGPVDRKIR